MNKLINIILIALLAASCTHLSDVQHMPSEPFEQHGEASEAIEKIEYFFDEFMSLLDKHDEYENGVTQSDLEADLASLCNKYNQYDANPLDRTYFWDDDKYTPMQFAARQGNLRMVQLLCSETYREKVTRRAKTETQELNALHLAAAGGYLQLVRYLIEEQGFNVDAQDSEGASALYYATYGKYINVVHYLVGEAGANVHILDKNGLSVLHIAAHVQSRYLASLFLDKMDADIVAKKDSKGKKAVDYAKTLEVQRVFECRRIVQNGVTDGNNMKRTHSLIAGQDQESVKRQKSNQ
ncbi:MAG: ankyrin repeat domain-containing protein [Bacteroidota bacterium]